MTANAPANPAEFVVSPLRHDVDLLPGPPQDDGSPTMILHDRFNDTFDRLEWREREIVKRMTRPVTLGQLEERLRLETTVDVPQPELIGFIADLRRRGLLQASRFRATPELLREAAAGRSDPFRWLIRHYLFFKVPLIRPDSFLRRTLWAPRFFGSPFMTAIYALVLIAAVALLVPRFETFLRSATPFLAWRGAIYLSLAMVAVKACHEFSHAYSAAVRGVRVRSMGIAFMVMAPIPYADVTDAYRLPRRSRLAISAAGVRTELVIASLALLAWCLAAPGPIRDLCLMMASASVLSTLLTNLNPGMRFDGYYLMTDLIGVDNLQQRGFCYARHWYRKVFLGLDDGGGVEHALGTGKKAGLVAWSMYAMLYRLGLYFGIALLVYHYFPKTIGIVLFAVEIAVFIVKPALREISDLSRHIRRSGPTVRLVAAAAAFMGLAAWFVAPLPRTVAVDAVMAADRETVVYVPASGILLANALKRGGTVAAGQVLLELNDPDLDVLLRRTELELGAADLLVEDALSGGEGRVRIRDRLAERARLASQLAGLRARRAKMAVRAEADSVVLDADESMTPGVWMERRKPAGRLLPEGTGRRLVAYLPDDSANSAKEGDSVVFTPESDPGLAIRAVVVRLDRQAAAVIGEPALAGPYGGGMAVDPRGDGLTPASPVYRLEALPDDPETAASVRLGQRGALRLTTPPRSHAADFALWLYGVLIRESGM